MATVEGELDAFGHVRLGGIGDRLAGEIEKRTGKESRAVVLGHLSAAAPPRRSTSGWPPGSLHAIQAVHDGDFGTMVALRDRRRPVPLIEHGAS